MSSMQDGLSPKPNQQKPGYYMSNNFAHDLENAQPRKKDMTFGKS